MSIKVTPKGKVKKTTQDVSLNIRISKEERDEFNACVILDAALHGGDANAAATARKLLRDFCRKVQTTAQSDVGRGAAATLRKKAG